MTSRLRRGLGSASLALLLGLTLAACGGDDSDDNGSGDKESSSSNDSGDNGSDDNASDDDGSDDDSSGEGSAPSEQDLEAALLSVDQLPSGFQPTVGDEDDSDDSDDNPFVGTCLEDVSDFDDKVGDPAAEAEIEYEQRDVQLPSSIEVSIAYYSDDVSDDFAEFVDELGSCPRVLSTVEGVTFDLDVTAEDFQALDADDASKITMAGSISSQGTSFPLTATVIAILKDGFVSTVSTFEFQTDTLATQASIWAGLQYSNVYELR